MKRSVVSLVFIGIATIALAWPAWAIDPPEFVLEWSTGEDPNDRPTGIGVDESGNVYVANYGRKSIQKFTGDGTFILEWGTLGTGDGQFNYPRSPIPDASGDVFVSDMFLNRVQKFTSDGTYILQWGTLGTGDGQFYYANGVLVDPAGNVYVTCGLHDSTPGYTRIQKFTGDGTFILKWGSFGSGNGQFYNPTGLAMDSDWNVYVADFRNHRVQKFTHDGTFLTKWGTPGTGDGQFNRPVEVAVDAYDNVYVADMQNHRIQVFSTDGTFLTKWGSYGSGEGQFYNSWDIAIDADGNIFVADDTNCRIQKFKMINTPAGPNVVVEPVDETTGTTPVTLTFDSVTVAGVTSLVMSKAGPDPEYGFRLCANNYYFDLTTTAVFTDSITVCIDYTDLQCGGPETKLQLMHWVDGDWDTCTVSRDFVEDVICGKVTSLSAFAIFEEYIGSVAGRITADCPDPETGIAGVDVDAFVTGTGELAGVATTDEFGAYQIDSLAADDYSISIITPIGYAALADEIVATVVGGEVTTADFALLCLGIQQSQRSIGFWKHQVGVALGGKGHADIEGPTLCSYLDLIEVHFNSNAINQVEIYEPPATGVCEDKLEVAGDLLNLKGNVGMTARAKKQLMSLLLNVASAKLSLREVISVGGATVSQAITFCDNVIDDATGDHETAKNICDWINNAEMVPAGVIPLDTDDIAYSPMADPKDAPVNFTLDQNHPNPFNPTTRISFSLDREGEVSLVVYDITGKEVKRLVDRPMSAGRYSEEWNGRDSRGNPVASGIYFYRLTAGNRTLTKKMVLLK